MHGTHASTDQLASFRQLLSLELGDIMTLPDGRQLIVRALERRLAAPAGSMTGFLLGGEIGPSATLVSIPPGPDAPVLLYTPLDYVPAHARDARVVCEGAVSYWAPHLPNLSGAMGELTHKVCALRGEIEPMVLMWRGRDLVVFIRSAVCQVADLKFLCLDRDPSATEMDQPRHAARVLNPALEPLPVPERVEAGTLYRQFVMR